MGIYDVYGVNWTIMRRLELLNLDASAFAQSVLPRRGSGGGAIRRNSRSLPFLSRPTARLKTKPAPMRD